MQPQTEAVNQGSERSSGAEDSRYERVRCVTCRHEFQRIDFRGNPHAFFCANPIETPREAPIYTPAQAFVDMAAGLRSQSSSSSGANQ